VALDLTIAQLNQQKDRNALPIIKTTTTTTTTTTGGLFDQNLARFRQAQDMIHERCGRLDVFPCIATTGDRNPIKNRDCLWKDSGCGNACIDTVALLWSS
jgi:hypothetical protein